jgi:hypothetical protein
MAAEPEKIREARELLTRERDDVLAALTAARAEAKAIAERQSAWRDTAGTLLERGAAAGLSVAKMARALGLSRQWTTHLQSEQRRRGQLHRVVFASRPLDVEPPTSDGS